MCRRRGWGTGQDFCIAPYPQWVTPLLPQACHEPPGGRSQGSCFTVGVRALEPSQSAQEHRRTPTQNFSTYLFLPTDIADNRAWGWAWRRSQDAHHSFWENLAHCGHQREETCIRLHPQFPAGNHAYGTCCTLLRTQYHLLHATYSLPFMSPQIPPFLLKHCHPARDTLLSVFAQPFSIPPELSPDSQYSHPQLRTGVSLL